MKFPYTVDGYVKARIWLRDNGMSHGIFGDSSEAHYLISYANGLFEEQQKAMENKKKSEITFIQGNPTVMLDSDSVLVSHGLIAVQICEGDTWKMRYFPLDEEKRRELINILQVPPSLPQESHNCVIIS